MYEYTDKKMDIWIDAETQIFVKGYIYIYSHTFGEYMCVIYR